MSGYVIPEASDLPEDNAKLAKVEVSFPTIPLSQVSPPSDIEPHLRDYLSVEGFALEKGTLQFLRIALVHDTVYWIWQFLSDGEKCYATATQDADDETCLGCGVDYHGLSPEQYILGDYYDCF